MGLVKKTFNKVYFCTPITAELELEHAQRVPEAEPVQPQVKLKDRQKFFEEAFQQDMEHYLSTGYLQIAERRGELCPFPRLKPGPDQNVPDSGIQTETIFQKVNMLYPVSNNNKKTFKYLRNVSLDGLVQKHSVVVITNKSAGSTALKILHWECYSQSLSR